MHTGKTYFTGRHAGCRIPGIDVDCTKYGGPGLLPKTETIGPARNKPCDPDFVMDSMLYLISLP